MNIIAMHTIAGAVIFISSVSHILTTPSPTHRARTPTSKAEKEKGTEKSEAMRMKKRKSKWNNKKEEKF